MVSYAAAKLDMILVPVPPQNSLDLTRRIIYQILAHREAYEGDIKPESSSDKPKVILHKMAGQNTKINI